MCNLHYRVELAFGFTLGAMWAFGQFGLQPKGAQLPFFFLLAGFLCSPPSLPDGGGADCGSGDGRHRRGKVQGASVRHWQPILGIRADNEGSKMARR